MNLQPIDKTRIVPNRAIKDSINKFNDKKLLFQKEINENLEKEIKEKLENERFYEKKLLKNNMDSIRLERRHIKLVKEYINIGEEEFFKKTLLKIKLDSIKLERKHIKLEKEHIKLENKHNKLKKEHTFVKNECSPEETLILQEKIRVTLTNFKHLYYSLKFKTKFIKWLWELVREPKIAREYHATYLAEHTHDVAVLNNVVDNFSYKQNLGYIMMNKTCWI